MTMIRMHRMHRKSPSTTRSPVWRNLRNEKVSLTMALITKLLTNPLAQSRSTEDAGDHSPASGPDHLTDRLSMAWKRSVDSSRAGPEIQPRRLTREAHAKLVADVWTEALTATAPQLTRTLATGRGRSRPCTDLCGRHARALKSAVADRGSAKRIARADADGGFANERWRLQPR